MGDIFYESSSFKLSIQWLNAFFKKKKPYALFTPLSSFVIHTDSDSWFLVVLRKLLILNSREIKNAVYFHWTAGRP